MLNFFLRIFIIYLVFTFLPLFSVEPYPEDQGGAARPEISLKASKYVSTTIKKFYISLKVGPVPFTVNLSSSHPTLIAPREKAAREGSGRYRFNILVEKVKSPQEITIYGKCQDVITSTDLTLITMEIKTVDILNKDGKKLSLLKPEQELKIVGTTEHFFRRTLLRFYFYLEDPTKELNQFGKVKKQKPIFEDKVFTKKDSFELITTIPSSATKAVQTDKVYLSVQSKKNYIFKVNEYHIQTSTR